MSLPNEPRRSEVILATKQLIESLPLKLFNLKPLAANFEKWRSKNHEKKEHFEVNKQNNVIIPKFVNFDLDNQLRQDLITDAEELKQKRFGAHDCTDFSKPSRHHIKPVDTFTTTFKGFFIWAEKNSLRLEKNLLKSIQFLKNQNEMISYIQKNPQLAFSQNFTPLIKEIKLKKFVSDISNGKTNQYRKIRNLLLKIQLLQIMSDYAKNKIELFLPSKVFDIKYRNDMK